MAGRGRGLAPSDNPSTSPLGVADSRLLNNEPVAFLRTLLKRSFEHAPRFLLSTDNQPLWTPWTQRNVFSLVSSVSFFVVTRRRYVELKVAFSAHVPGVIPPALSRSAFSGSDLIAFVGTTSTWSP